MLRVDPATATGLRERKKAATRQALHEAALRLAMAHGLDRVTSEAVADAAGVSRRTFSNYFANKEQALLHGDHATMRLLVDLVLARPAGEPAWPALTASARQLLAHLGDRDPDWVARTRLVRRHPSLAAHQVAMYASVERDLAAAIHARPPAGDTVTAAVTTAGDATGMRPRLIAASFLAALRVATNTWLDQPAGTSLSELVHEALRTVATSFHDGPEPALPADL
jgi:AcrR family transcriptional regulator